MRIAIDYLRIFTILVSVAFTVIVLDDVPRMQPRLTPSGPKLVTVVSKNEGMNP